MYKNIMLLMLSGLSCSAFALENGVSIYKHGVESFLGGAVPPPGVHSLVYANYYNADQLNDGNGDNRNIPGFEVSAVALAPRVIWVSEQKLFGGNMVLGAILPLVRMDSKMMGQIERKEGLGDAILEAALGYHHSPNLHTAVALEMYFPTGDYDKNDFANIGTNRYAVEPLYALSFINGRYSADFKAGYIFNGENKDTDYKSGDEFHFDYALGLNFGSYTLGVGGYYQQQIQEDEVNGVSLENSKTRGFSIGPNVKYQVGDWFTTLKYEKEIIAENKTKGDSVWLKVIMPF